MKKIFFAVIIICTILMLSSCQKDLNWQGEAIEQYDLQKVITIEGDSKGFLVSQKKYEYNGNNIVILRTENQSSNAYSITIIGEFLDENGEVISTQKKEFEGYPANYKNYFIFETDTKFDEFSYELSTTPFEGDTFAQYVISGTSVDIEAYEMRSDLFGNIYDPSRVALKINFPIDCTSPNDDAFTYSADFVLFDKNGEIYLIDSLKQGKTPSSQVVTRICLLPDNFLWKDFELPEELEGDLKGIIAFNWISK